MMINFMIMLISISWSVEYCTFKVNLKGTDMMRVTIIIMIINIRHGRGSLFDYGDQFYDNDDFEYDDDYDDQ